jgi:hypothetical protein
MNQMSKHNIEIVEIVAVDGDLVVRGTVGETQFEAQNLRWGSKMLMHVKAAGLDRGTRVAIGHRAKAAIKAAGLVLPEAVLKRPRKEKVEAPEVVTVAAPTPVDTLPLDTFRVDSGDGFFTLS